MGNKGSAELREFEDKFDANELIIIKVAQRRLLRPCPLPHDSHVRMQELFRDLAQRSPGKTIDKPTFLKNFALPGLLGERLFTVFDRKNTGVIGAPRRASRSPPATAAA